MPEHDRLNAEDLTFADLRSLDLIGHDFSNRDLTCADFRGSNLTHADFRSADLIDADLSHTNLTGALLSNGSLYDADLTEANLTGANLTGAILTSSTLTRAGLTAEQLRSANTAEITRDLYTVLAAAGKTETAALLAAMHAGRIDGSFYVGPCCCLIGTLANAANLTLGIGGVATLANPHIPAQWRFGGALYADMYRPAERWFYSIRPGDTPATHAVSAVTAEWITAWIAQQP